MRIFVSCLNALSLISAATAVVSATEQGTRAPPTLRVDGTSADLGATKFLSLPHDACITGHCAAAAILSPVFAEAFTKAERATDIVAVSGQGLLSDLGMAWPSNRVAAPGRTTADG